MTENSFEKNLQRLEEIVKLLESDTVSLDESISLYKEGIELSKICHDKLDNAKQTVKEISLPNANEE